MRECRKLNAGIQKSISMEVIFSVKVKNLIDYGVTKF